MRSEKSLFDYPQDDSSKNSLLITAIELMDKNKKYSKKGFFLNVCKERRMSASIVIFLRKNLWLQSMFNKVIDDLQSSGLIQHAVEQFAQEKYFKMTEPIAERKKLSIDQLSGIFQIWLIGLGISILAFALEIAFDKYLRHKKFSFSIQL